MDPENQPSGSRSGPPWTNEKHVNFLNSMEASFVRTMFENNGHLLRLDRYLPDSWDSTQDLKPQRRKKQVTKVDHNMAGPRARLNNRGDRRRRQSYQSQTSSQDQVVPELGNRRDDKDEGDPSNLLVAPAN